MSQTMNKAQFYEQEGYLPATPVYTPAEQQRYRQFFDGVEEREGKTKSTFSLQNLHYTEPIVWEMATHPKVLDVMQEIMGENILLFRTVFMCKYPAPDAKGFFAWHQDGAYWGLHPAEAHIAWIAIDDSDTENGCLRVIPGSHKKEIILHSTSGREGNFLRIDQALPDQDVPAEQAVDLVQKAGTMSIHHANTFHASEPNRSTRRRCGLIVGYVRPEVQQSIEHMPQKVGEDYRWRPFKVLLVRGQDQYNHFAYADPVSFPNEPSM